jgi:serine/threonine protein kinase
LAIQIAGALEEAHAKGILHRDLKPANILLTAKCDSKLLDFGLAKLMDAADDEATKTIEGTMLGTAAYMSPEQAQAQPLDERSDIFSFGRFSTRCSAAAEPFPGEHALTTLGAVIHRDPDPLQAPPDIVRIVTRCLRKSPAEHFQHVAEIRTALEAANLVSGVKDPPSIAVLPFANMSASKDDEYFSDGLAEGNPEPAGPCPRFESHGPNLLVRLPRGPAARVEGAVRSYFLLA